jgi:hypothetical protein
LPKNKTGFLDFDDCFRGYAVVFIDNKIQMAKRRARGYRNIDNFINMIYFLCGKLRFDYIIIKDYNYLQ